MMPGSAAGTMTVKTARARVAPSASAPSRIAAGTSSSSSSVVRAMIGIIIDAEREAAGQGAELLERQHRHAVDEHADDDRRHAVQRVGGETHRRGEARAGILGHVDAAQDADRNRHQRRRARSASACRRWRWPCRRRASPTGRGMFVKNSRLSAWTPWLTTKNRMKASGTSAISTDSAQAPTKAADISLAAAGRVSCGHLGADDRRRICGRAAMLQISSRDSALTISVMTNSTSPISIERRQVELVGGLGELVGDHRRHRVLRREQRQPTPAGCCR